MGVPKFYRWISERYPCLSQVVKDYQIPEFDNFYLDMNGIIHVCAHPNDDDATFRISDEKIFNDIFTYLESLFRIIKPQKVLFLAVDGVAPRAKMNQQRGRRFRSAREAQDLVRKALQKGVILPSEPRFDSNCITPGTDFMARLHEQLQYFVNKKMATDPSWQKVEVILSGQNVPGEGEHKIMDYIRYQKSQPNYDPNTRHCLYGLDADLMMLGLATHEPHFSLLREEVRFGRKSQRRQTSPDTVTFHLLHLSIMREYIDFEFLPIKDKLLFGYDLERIIDDWILMGFLVGNDFIPHLPNMHISHEALPFLYQKYMEVLPTLDGYINEGGTLHMERFEAYMRALAQFDYDHFSELISDMKWMEAKKTGGRGKRKKKVAEPVTESETDTDVGFFPAGLAGTDEDEDSETSQKLKRDLGIPSLKAYFEDEDQDRVDSFEQELMQVKVNYYKEKMGFTRVDDDVLAEQAKCFVVGIQWILHYYYTGVPSWSWFYPYHYAPYVSDVKGFSDLSLTFELGTPFLPFEQLLAVLPPASKSLLPKCLQGLMVNEDSPLKYSYPVDFKTDLNGKQQEWEAVVLIPFIDQDQLLEAMQPYSVHFTEDEVKMNAHGTCSVYCYDPEMTPFTYPSPWQQMFPDISNCKVRHTELPSTPYAVEEEQLVQGLCPGVRLDVYFPGFPTLKHMAHTGHFDKRGVRVFQAASRGDNLILTVLPMADIPKDMYKFAKLIIGKVRHVGWPHLVEAKVHAIADGKTKYYQDSGSHKSRAKIVEHVMSEKERKQWREDETAIYQQYMERKGIDIGPVDILVYAQVLQGKRYILDRHGAKGSMCLHKEWASTPTPFAFQTTVGDIATYAPEYREKTMTLSEFFPVKSQCFVMSPPHYGSLAEVVSVDMTQLRVHVKVKVRPGPDIDAVMANRQLCLQYIPSYVVAGQLKMPSLALSRITGNVQVERGSRDNKPEREKLNIGLNWKFSKRNQEILGYARKLDNGWSFSPSAVSLLKQFQSRFPRLLEYICANPGEDKYYEEDLFPDIEGPETLSSLREWLKQLPSYGMEAVECGSFTLDGPQIAAIEEAVLNMEMPRHFKTVKLKVKPSVLYKPTDRQGNLIPDVDADYQLFDRVVNVSTNNAVPFGLRGTVSGILGDGSDRPLLIEIVFDEEFLGGLTLRCSPNRAYRLPTSCLLNISYGKRSEAKREAEKHAVHMHPGMSYSAALQAPYGYGSPRHRRGDHVENTWGAYSAPYSTRSTEHVNRPPRYDKGGSPQVKIAQPAWRRTEDEKRTVTSPSAERSLSPAASSQRSGRDTARTSEPKSAAASEFSSMMKEMESHSKKAQVAPSPKHTVLRYSQQSLSKQRESRESHSESSVDEDSRRGNHDEFTAAVDALSKLNISSKSGTQAGTQQQQQQPTTGRSETEQTNQREFSPAVAAVFDAVSENPCMNAPYNVSKLESNEKAKMDEHQNALPRQSPQGKMPDMFQKLMHPPPQRGPLLPSPVYYQPRLPIRGSRPLLPGYPPARHPLPPPAPFGPPPMDPITLLHQTTFMSGHPPPKITAKETQPGVFVGVVEMGKMKYKGVPCSSAEDAKQSAAAVANSNIQPPPRMPLLYYYPTMPPPPPPGAPGPFMPGPPSRYPGPPPLYPMGPPGPYHPRGPRPPPPGGAPSVPPNFVPLQVQRRQAQKPPQTKPPAERKTVTGISEKPNRTAKTSELQSQSRPDEEALSKSEPPLQQDNPISDEEKLKLASESAKRNILESLNIAAQRYSDKQATITQDIQVDTKDLSGEVTGSVQPDSPGEKLEVDEASENRGTSGEAQKVENPGVVTADLLEHLEAVVESNKESKTRIQRLTEIKNVLEATADLDLVLSTPALEEQLHMSGSADSGDTVAQAALLSVGSPAEYETAQHPTDSSETTLDNIHIVGEIVAAGQLPSSVSIPSDSSSALNKGSAENVIEPDHSPSENAEDMHSQSATEAVLDKTGAEKVTEKQPPSTSSSVLTKRPKRQLAATFMHNTE